jgi:anti-sigma factor RsiW
VIGHLGPRVSALLDGQLPSEEEDRAWAHLDHCGSCHAEVQRQGWVKTRLAGLSSGGGGDCAPAGLKGSLRGAPDCLPVGLPPGDLFLALERHTAPRPRRTAGLAAIGGGAVGAAVMGVLVLGTAPADAPNLDRRTPVTSIAGTSTPTAPLPRQPRIPAP